MSKPFSDRRVTSLLSRVREDIDHLRQDLGSLVQHATRHTLPEGARELADTARSRIAEGGHLAAERLRSLGSLRPPASKQTLGILGGALLVGLIAAGVYAIVKSEQGAGEGVEEEGEEDDLVD